MKQSVDKVTDINSELAVHKEGNTSFVPPILASNFLIVVALSYNSSWEYFVAVGLTLFAIGANFSFVRLNPTVSWLRNDIVDTVRWCINIVLLDVPISIFMNTSRELVFCWWLTVVLGVFIDVYEKRLRIPVTALAIGCAIFSFRYSFPDIPWASIGAFVCAMLAVIAFVVAIEKSWMKESAMKSIAQKRETELVGQAEELFKSSLLGENARLIAHEVDNMITAINFATDNPKEIEVGNINLSLGYVKQACNLIMRESTAQVHTTTVEQILQDINLLIRKQVESQGLMWSISCDRALLNIQIRERSGSCYFILQNFIRNASRAVSKANTRSPKVTLLVEKIGTNLVFTVLDNGIGIDEETRQKLLAGQGKEIESHQHGIGMKFVLIECKRNGFQVFIEPAGGEYKTAVGFKLNLETTPA